jgi:hypothetical protein
VYSHKWYRIGYIYNWYRIGYSNISVQWEPRWYTRTDGLDDINGRFSLFMRKTPKQRSDIEKLWCIHTIIKNLRLGQGLLIIETSRSYLDTPQSLGLLWASDQLITWIITGIRTSCKHKRELYLIYKRSNNPLLKKHYKLYCRILLNVIREEKIITSVHRLKTQKIKWKPFGTSLDY